MKLIKVIYFDESTVADFMQIVAGGEIKKTTEFITSVSGETQGELGVEASIGTEAKGLPKLFSFLSGMKINASAKVEADASYKKDRIIKNILENTLLADFVDLIKNDQKRKAGNKRCAGIRVFEDLSIYPELNSFSFLMLAAPFFSMLDGDVPISSDDGNTFKLDISKIEEAIGKGRGYYEFIAEHEGKDIILRFNSSAFRNNYTMSDLPKMQLTCYAVHVGKTQKKKLRIEQEFEFGTKRLTRIDYADASNDASNTDNSIDVFDVILAGIVEK